MCGPMAAVIATLQDIGWAPLAPTRWRDERGVEYEIDLMGPGVVPTIAAKVRDRCIQQNWAKAAEHYCGRGAEYGVDLTVLLKARQQLTKDGSIREAGILDMLAQGAAWTPEWRAATGSLVEATCHL